MGQQARRGGGVRQNREAASRGVRPRDGSTSEAARSEAADRAVAGAREAGERGFVLQGYDRATEELRIELHLKPVPIERLRTLFEVGDDREMSNAYPIDRVRAHELQPFVAETVDIERYDFFLQRYA